MPKDAISLHRKLGEKIFVGSKNDVDHEDVIAKINKILQFSKVEENLQ